MDIDIDFGFEIDDDLNDLDDVKYINYGRLYISNKKTGLRKTSLDLTLNNVEDEIRKIYECQTKKHKTFIKILRKMPSFYVSVNDDIVEIYYNHKLCKLDRKELIFELDKYFTKEAKNEEMYYCVIL